MIDQEMPGGRRENVVVDVSKNLFFRLASPGAASAIGLGILPFPYALLLSCLYFHRSNCLLHGLLHDILSPSSSFLMTPLQVPQGQHTLRTLRAATSKITLGYLT